jgi:hypothetical protein
MPLLLLAAVSPAQGQSSESRYKIAYDKLMAANNLGGQPPAPFPILNLCRADIAAWKQADDDAIDRFTHRCDSGTCAKAEPLPEALLSTVELYRRKWETTACRSVLIGAFRKNKSLSRADREYILLDIEARESNLLTEILSPATDVIDNNHLWEELLLQQGH